MCNELKFSPEEEALRIDATNNAFLEGGGRMYIQELKTEGRGWNWGRAIVTKTHRIRVRLLSWFPFVRITARAMGGFEEVDGRKFESAAPNTPATPRRRILERLR